jgi:thymidylate kinase
MYIAIEGVKGVGKSTLVRSISHWLDGESVNYVMACPTKKINGWDLYEFIYTNIGFLENVNRVKDIIYARRANKVAKHTNWKSPVVLGDRSILTSYITRLWEDNNPEDHIKLIDTLQPAMPAPDYILYLKAGISDILDRIKIRGERDYGKTDEHPNRIAADIAAYDYVIANRLANRLSNTEYIILDASKSKKEVFDESKKIISELINKTYTYESKANQGN